MSRLHAEGTQPARARTDSVPSGVSIMATGPGYEGYVVIDTIVQDRSSGGVRIAGDLPLDEVRELAREMSLKYALFHLPRGGAKAGVRMSDALESEARLRALRDFGQRLAPLIRKGIYSPGMDMNCGPDELRAIYRGAGIELGKITDTSWFTAMSVFHALNACRDALGVTDRPLNIAIEGFGSVARHLAQRLDARRFRILAVATIEGAVRAHEPFEPQALARLREEHGDAFVRQLAGERIDHDEVLSSQVDVVLPSSRIWMITPQLAHALAARAVVPIANAPYGEGAVDILTGKNVICLPGYLSNVGGVLASSLFDQGVPTPDIEALFASEFRQIVDGILRVAARQGLAVTDVAARLAEMHMPARSRHQHRSLARRIHDRFLHPRLPLALRARLALGTFQRRFHALRAEIAQLERQA